MVDHGGHALVTRCEVHSYAAHGIYANRAGNVTARSSISRNNGAHGFQAINGGLIYVGPGCVAIQNGFVSYGAGSALTAGDGTVSDTNKQVGFCALKGGMLTTGANCKALGGIVGFAAVCCGSCRWPWLPI